MDSHSKLKASKGKGLFKSKKKILTSLGTALGLMATFFFPTQPTAGIHSASMLPFPAGGQVSIGEFPVVVPTLKYGFALDTFQVSEAKVEAGMTFGKLMSDHGVSVETVNRLVANSKDIFNVANGLRVQKGYTLLSDQKTGQAKYFIYEPNRFEYVIFGLTGELKVERLEKEVEIERVAVSGIIESSLWATLTKQGVSFEAAAKMEDALQWSVDFSHTQVGDKFRMIYDKKFIEGEEVGVGQVYAACYTREGKDAVAIWFDDGEHKGYYDVEGRAIESSFLKSPVKYTRISSRYNKRRFHPVLKRVRPHLGTDYAAPYGTPIYAVGNGVVTQASYTKGNGRFVKIKHDKVYQTQYLHMSRIAKGMKPGTPVAQGEVIGYVGSSGLATGPHVCFRFWKNGVQVDFLRESLPQAKPLPEEVLPAFFTVRDGLLEALEKVEIERPAMKKNSEPSAP